MQIDDKRFRKHIDKVHEDLISNWISGMRLTKVANMVDAMDEGTSMDLEETIMAEMNMDFGDIENILCACSMTTSLLIEMRDSLIACGIEWPENYLLDETRIMGCRDFKEIMEAGITSVDLGKYIKPEEIHFEEMLSDESSDGDDESPEVPETNF